MFRYLILFCITLGSLQTFGQETSTPTTTTYYFIRHAEKNRSNPSEKDPHLTEQGHKRAQNWNKVLENIHFDAIYTTDYNRTRETAQPTALKNQLEIKTYNAKSNFNEPFKKATYGKTVLVVGHSNTIPDFVNAVIGNKKYDDIDDGNNGNIYIVSLTGDNILDMVLTIN